MKSIWWGAGSTVMTLVTVAFTASCARTGDADGPAAEESAALEQVVTDTLYVSDFSAAGNNRVDRFSGASSATGTELSPLIPTGSNGLRGPTGLVFNRPHEGELTELLLCNQLTLPQGGPGGGDNGEVMEFSGATSGVFRGLLVAPTDPHALFFPQGIVVGCDGVVYVTDLGSMGFPAPVHPRPGRVARYDGRTGHWLGDLSLDISPGHGYQGPFHPRALVFGPDGNLYVASVNADPTNLGTGIRQGGGAVLRFNTVTGRLQDVFVDGGDPGDSSHPSTCNNCDLNRPQGLVFNPSGTRLYIASFRLNAQDNDKILVFDAQTGDFQPAETINLDQVGHDRAFAQAILFGPEGKLYVPISGGPQQGAIRRYDVSVSPASFVTWVAADSPTRQPSFLTFGKTDPGTLAYDVNRCGAANAPR